MGITKPQADDVDIPSICVVRFFTAAAVGHAR